MGVDLDILAFDYSFVFWSFGKAFGRDGDISLD